MRDINDIRQEIDDIDDQLVRLFCQRMECAKAVAEYKKANDQPVFNRERENAIMQNVEDKAGEYGEFANRFFRNIFSISRKLQYDVIHQDCAETDALSQANSLLRGDIFAMQTTGIVVEDAHRGYARCSFDVEHKHLNRNGVVMGGAMFTLCDFTACTAAHIDRGPMVTLNADIVYHSPGVGKKLIAEAHEIKDGRTICYYNVTVKNDEDRLIATMHMTGYRINKK